MILPSVYNRLEIQLMSGSLEKCKWHPLLKYPKYRGAENPNTQAVFFTGWPGGPKEGNSQYSILLKLEYFQSPSNEGWVFTTLLVLHTVKRQRKCLIAFLYHQQVFMGGGEERESALTLIINRITWGWKQEPFPPLALAVPLPSGMTEAPCLWSSSNECTAESSGFQIWLMTRDI